MTVPSFGDNVRIRRTPETEAAGMADRVGLCSGFTTPSVTGVQVVGSSPDDFALAVMFEDDVGGDAWFASGLVEFVDHAPGTEFRVGNARAVRRADGTWDETFVNPPESAPPAPKKPAPWWQFWRRG